MDLTERVDALEKRVAYLERQLQLSQSQNLTDNMETMNNSGINAQDTGSVRERPVFVPRPQNTVRPEILRQELPHQNSVLQETATHPAAKSISSGQTMPVQTAVVSSTAGQAIPGEAASEQAADRNSAANVSGTGAGRQAQRHEGYGKIKSRDMESFIGKNVFVVAASVLIFVGLVVFAAAVMPYLSAEIKFAAMILGSVGLTVAGYLLSHRKQSVFNVSLLACGLGAIYVTLFTGKIYFKFIADVPLYASLLVWCVIVFYCSKYKSLLFNIIGQAGILISLTMGTTEVRATDEMRMAIYLSVYVLIAEILYSSLFKDKNYLINSVSAMLSVIILAVMSHDFIYEIKYGSGMAVTVIFFALLAYATAKNIVYAKKGSISAVSYTVTGYLAYFSLIVAMTEVMDVPNFSAYTTALFGLFMFAITEYVFYGKDEESVTAIFLSVMSCVSVFCYYCAEHCFISAMIIPALIVLYSRLRNEDGDALRMAAASTTLCGAFFSTIYILREKILSDDFTTSDPAAAAYLITGLVLILLICAISKQRSQFEKISYYLALLAVVLIQIPLSPYVSLWISEDGRRLMCVCLMLCIQLYIKLRKDFTDEDKPLFSQGTFICFFAVNALCMLYSLYALHCLSDHAVMYAVALAAAAGLFGLNVMNLMNTEDSRFSPYIGVKFTVLIIAVANEFANKPITSILLFIWAIICLVSGQKLRQKPLRLYALILALLSTIKLLVFDIAYDNLVMRAFSLLICGGLCFGISLFYSRLEKSNKDVH